jgi:hypothetical protein
MNGGMWFHTNVDKIVNLRHVVSIDDVEKKYGENMTYAPKGVTDAPTGCALTLQLSNGKRMELLLSSSSMNEMLGRMECHLVFPRDF